MQLKEDQQRALLRREFELQSLSLQRRLEQKFWSQEKNMLVQESQQFKHNFLLLFMKLRWFLKRWRQGKVLPSEGDDFLEVWFPWDWDWGASGVEERGGEGAPSWVNTALGLRSKPSAGSFHPCIHALIRVSLLRASSSLSAVAGAGDTVVKTWSQTPWGPVGL